MDSYTDVSGQCCGCGRSRVSRGMDSDTGYMRSDYADMSSAPWPLWGDEASYPFSPAPYQQAGDMSCPSNQAGVLEQQFPLAMAYVPWQQWQTTYAPERGLVQGTIFPELDLQFNYGRCSR